MIKNQDNYKHTFESKQYEVLQGGHFIADWLLCAIVFHNYCALLYLLYAKYLDLADLYDADDINDHLKLTTL